MKHTLIVLGMGLALYVPTAGAAADGRVSCSVTENGRAAQGTIHLRKDGQEVASGSCSSDGLSVPAGEYTAVLQLDGALDGPEQSRSLTVKAGQKVTAEAEFATGTLEVRINSKGRRAAGMAMIRKGGKQIGTLGGGVVAHLSAGTYEIVVRYRDQERRFDAVTLERGKPQVVEVAFD